MDPMMPSFVAAVAAVLAIGLFMRAIKQPSVVAYLVAGVALGPSGLGLMTDQVGIARLGEVGVVLLLFFIGMEVSLPKLVARWKAPVVGTLLQVAISVGVVAIIGAFFEWPWSRVVLVGFVISLSSTAVVMKLLQTKGEIESPIGQDILGVLLVQDLVVIPMIIVLAMIGGSTPSTWQMGLQIVGGVGAIAALVHLATRTSSPRLPLGTLLRRDHELQVFAACFICFGLATLSGALGLSAALGAFIAGIYVGSAKETRWFHEALFPAHVIFLAIFFVSVGMLIDLGFLVENAQVIALVVLAVLVTNTVINVAIFRALGRSWPNSVYGGAALSQIGEFSFVLAAIGKQAGLVTDFAYQVTVLAIALSLLVSPTWIAIANMWRQRASKPVATPRDG